jgi:uncharacterized membrane protein
VKLIALAATVVAVATAASAQTLPSLFDVTGVAPSDLLNVREGPDTSETIIGRLAADARGIEVVTLDPSGGWGLINAGERAGWVSMRFLAEQPDVWAPGRVPAGLACLGTEPFWSLRPEGAELVYDTPDGGAQRFPLVALDTGVPGDVRRALVAGAGGLTATVTPRVCSDGMSDRVFGLETLVILEADGAPRLLSGCCTIAPNG